MKTLLMILSVLWIGGCATVKATRTASDGTAVTVEYRRFFTSYNAKVEDPKTGLNIQVGAETETQKLTDLIKTLAPLIASGAVGALSGGGVP